MIEVFVQRDDFAEERAASLGAFFERGVVVDRGHHLSTRLQYLVLELVQVFVEEEEEVREEGLRGGLFLEGQVLHLYFELVVEGD